MLVCAKCKIFSETVRHFEKEHIFMKEILVEG